MDKIYHVNWASSDDADALLDEPSDLLLSLVQPGGILLYERPSESELLAFARQTLASYYDEDDDIPAEGSVSYDATNADFAELDILLVDGTLFRVTCTQTAVLGRLP